MRLRSPIQRPGRLIERPGRLGGQPGGAARLRQLVGMTPRGPRIGSVARRREHARERQLGLRQLEAGGGFLQQRDRLAGELDAPIVALLDLGEEPQTPADDPRRPDAPRKLKVVFRQLLCRCGIAECRVRTGAQAPPRRPHRMRVGQAASARAAR